MFRSGRVHFFQDKKTTPCTGVFIDRKDFAITLRSKEDSTVSRQFVPDSPLTQQDFLEMSNFQQISGKSGDKQIFLYTTGTARREGAMVCVPVRDNDMIFYDALVDPTGAVSLTMLPSEATHATTGRQPGTPPPSTTKGGR